MPKNNQDTQRENIENINDLNEKRLTAEKQLYNALRKNSKELEISNKKHVKAMDSISKSQKNFNQNLNDTKALLKDAASIYISLNTYESTLSAAKNVVTMEKSLYRSSINAGKTAEEGKKVVGIAAQMRMNFGATAEDAEKVLKTFVKGQYKGNIKDAASASYQFARAMDVSQETVAKNTLELQKWGQIGPKAATAMYADIMKVAQGYGLTSEGAEGVIKTTTKLSGYMRAFGKNETEIQKMNFGFAKMVSSMEKVGVAAQDALAMVEQLLDPERIEENIPAYAALGISITDAINGNIDPEQITSGMKEIGNKLKEMGPIAGAAYAKAMGISYKNAIKSADLDQITEEAMTPQETAAEQMKQLAENTKTMTEKLDDFINKIQGMFQSLGPLFMFVVSGVVPKIGKKIFEKIKNSLSKGIEEGATDGETRAQKILSEIQNKKIKINAEVDLKQKNKEVNQEAKETNKKKKEITTTTGRKNFQAEIKSMQKEVDDLNDFRIKKTAELNAIYDGIQTKEKKILELTANGNKLTEKQQNELKKAEDFIRDQTLRYEEQNKTLIDKKDIIDKLNTKIEDGNKLLENTAGIKLKKTFKEIFDESKSDMLKDFNSKQTNKEEKKPGKVAQKLINWKEGAAEFTKEMKKNSLKDIGNGIKSWTSNVIEGAKDVTAKMLGKTAAIAEKIATSLPGRAVGKVGRGVKKVATGIGGGITKALSKLGPLAGGIMLLVGLLMKLEPVQRAIEIVMTKVGTVLDEIGSVLRPIFEEITGVMLDLLDGLMPLIGILAHMLIPILKVMLIPLKLLTWAIQKLTRTQSKNNVSLEANTDQMKKEETKPAQIKRNADGTLSSTMATVKSEDSSGASKQNTVTETRSAAVADGEIKQKLDTISNNLYNLNVTMERYLNYSFIIEKNNGYKEDSNSKKQSQIMKQSIKEGLESIGELKVSVQNFPKKKGIL